MITNYKPFIEDKLKEYFDKLPHYSMGDIIYSVLTECTRKGNPSIKKSDLLKMDDKMFHDSLQRSLLKEVD